MMTTVSFVHAQALDPDMLAWGEDLVRLRRDVHRTPELGFDTPKTVQRIVKTLRSWGIGNIDADLVAGGVIVVIDGERPGRTVALRADIDALGMNDTSGSPWASEVLGRSHACGHDGHQTWLMGALRYLNAHRDFPGRVVGIFQPAEELARGAQAVISCGVLTKYDIAEIYGAHTEPLLEKGVFGFRVGPLQASGDLFCIRIKGKGTHGGRPHLGVDPLPAAAQLIDALQTIVSRRINPIDSAVVSVCSLNAGRYETPNVVPDEVRMSGTVRAFLPQTRCEIEASIRTMAEGIARAHGCVAEVDWQSAVAAVINDEAATRAAIAVARSLFGSAAVDPDMDPFMSSEDFSAYQEKIPGCMLRVGVRDRAHQATVHSTAFDFNDAVLPAAAQLLACIATARLRALAQG